MNSGIFLIIAGGFCSDPIHFLFQMKSPDWELSAAGEHILIICRSQNALHPIQFIDPKITCQHEILKLFKRDLFKLANIGYKRYTITDVNRNIYIEIHLLLCFLETNVIFRRIFCCGYNRVWHNKQGVAMWNMFWHTTPNSTWISNMQCVEMCNYRCNYMFNDMCTSNIVMTICRCLKGSRNKSEHFTVRP